MTSIDLGRRRFLLAAPAVILTPGLLMPVREIWTLGDSLYYGEPGIDAYLRECEKRIVEAMAVDLRAMLMPPARAWFTLTLSAQAEKDLLLGRPPRQPGTP